MSSPQPYQIHVPDDKIHRLERKLALADFPNDAPDSDGTSWDRGPPVSEIRRLVKVWQEGYSWRRAESMLNKLPQFMIPITVDSLDHSYDIHFVHKKSTREDAIPLLFLHGWPGSFIEVTKLIDTLVAGDGEDEPVFHIVAPSLVDFGFSSASTKGFRFTHHAEVYHKLMLNLGYGRYVVQAGDMGALISRFMAKQYGSSGLVAYHTNTPAPAEPKKETHPDLFEKIQSTPLTEHEVEGMARTGRFMTEGQGYYKMQSTKPTTLGFSFRDSPVGLLAWLYEKMHEWSDDYPWTDEEILTWVSIYFFSTVGPEASSNAYYAMEHDVVPAFAAASTYVDVPLGISRFQKDLIVLPKLWNQSLGPVVWEDEHARGGHFAAWERPDAISGALRLMFGNKGPLKDLFGSV